MMNLLAGVDISTTWALIITFIILWLSYVIISWNKQRNYFKSLGIKTGPTPLPFIGSLLDVARMGVTKHDTQLIKDYGKIVGYFEGTTPVIMCTDTKMLKKVFIKDFNNFRNRRPFGDYFEDPFKNFLLALKDDEWKTVRSIISPTFTSGKLKGMMKTIKPCSDAIIEHVEKLAENDDYFDAQKVFGSYAFDVISSCCFGVRGDLLNDADSEIIKCFNKILAKDAVKFFFIFLVPRFSYFLQKHDIVEFVPKDAYAYLRKLITEIIGRRKAKLEFRNDFIQTMADYDENDNSCEDDPDLKTNTNKKTLTHDEIMAQAVLFMLAGYESTAMTLGYIGYNLAMNIDCQTKLIAEIDDALHKHGEINYEMINDIPYLEMVINETLRLYPPATRTDRHTSEDYEYEGMKIPKDTVINVSIWAVHHDPDSYPEPEKFIPERFDEENNIKRDNEAFMPFGTGPRYCIGMRLALMEMKFLICELLTKFEFTTCEKTPMKIIIDDTGFSKPKEPIILKLKKRFS